MDNSSTSRDRPKRSTVGVSSPDKLAFAREQRAQATAGEQMLWQALRVRTVRCSDRDVLENIDEVVARIREELV